MKKILCLLPTLALAGCDHSLSTDESSRAEIGAVKYSQAMQADYVSCSGLDSNNDGYVTCTLKDRTTGKPLEVVCSYNASGCKTKE